MRSLRTKITIMTLCVVIIAVAVVTVLSVFFIRKTERRKSDQILLLLCETGERNLDYYFNSVQKSVAKVASFVEADITGLDDEDFSRHMKTAEKYFDEIACKTNGVLTYYYRIDPTVSDTVKGFWYTNLDGDGFVEHEVTDITQYDTSDTSKLVWFTVPKYEGKAIWLPPYITDNLDVRVISYNMPIQWRGQFIGVVGIEIDYSTMAEQVDSIRLYDNGYAFLSDEDGNLFYHPRIDVTQLTEETMPAIPDGALAESTFVRYSFEGVKKEAAWLALSNGMRLNVAAPISETEGDWKGLIRNITIVAAEVLIAASVFTMIYTRRIVRPLRQLTEAAEQVDRGNYDTVLEYDKDDELGKLTSTFKRLSSHMKDHISDLNKQVFVDALTHVKNKGAFADFTEDLQKKIDDGGKYIEFAIGVFDCDDLKKVNDKFGHEKGDLYLKAASRAICSVFQHSPVFRIGGDEFSVILRNEDYGNREALIRRFEKVTEEINNTNENVWEQVHISMGVAVYDPDNDSAVTDVVRRADKTMYENKRLRKKGR
ncbi:MAG: diguanylate cyclase [Clostridia bacterium]|nr:diguanylate cyclase [Clostridia bacterium]